MATLNVSLPDKLREFIKIRVESGEFQSASDYIRDLIRHDREQLEHLLADGINSGKSKPLDLDAIRNKARKALESKKGQ